MTRKNCDCHSLHGRGLFAKFEVSRKNHHIMNIILPNKINGGKPDIINDARRVTVIGANGAGKTRFSTRLIEMFPHRAYKLSALKAIFPTTSINHLEGSIDMLYNDKASLTRPG